MARCAACELGEPERCTYFVSIPVDGPRGQRVEECEGSLTAIRFWAGRDLLVAADRMRDRWAEADTAVKQQLWRDLHTKADEYREAMAF